MELGTVKKFWRNEGYGFITPDVPRKDGRDVFVYHQHIRMPGFRRLLKGQRVRFSMGKDDQGRPMAVDVEFVVEGLVEG